jgi:phosphoribosylanthranilate isomerase
MRDAENIASVGALRPDYMGFIFVPSSPRFVGASLSADAVALPSHIQRIGVFQDAPLEEVLDRISQFTLKGVQLHGDEDSDYMQALRTASPGTLILKAVRVQSAQDIAHIATDGRTPDLFVLDSKAGGSGTSFDWTWLSYYAASVPYLLAGGIGLAELDAVEKLAEKHPLLHGIDVNSRVERSPGVKETKLIQEIAKRLRL